MVSFHGVLGLLCLPALALASGPLFCGETGVRGMDNAVRLRCDNDGDVISAITFASFGTPFSGADAGACENWHNTTCDAGPIAQQFVSQQCVGMRQCAIPSFGQLFGGNICNKGNWLAITATCAEGTGTANGGESCVVNGTACPLPNPALWPPQWNLSLSTVVEPGRDSSPYWFNFTDDKPWGLVSLDGSTAEKIWTRPNRNDTYVEATLTENCRRIKEASPGTRCFLYHNLELALQFFESQRAVMYDPAFQDFFIQVTDGQGHKNGVTYNEGGDPGDQFFWDFRNASAADYYISSVLALTNNPNVDGVFTDDYAGFASEHDFAPINTNINYSTVADLQYASLAVHGRLVDALAARGKGNYQAWGGGYQGEYPQQGVPSDPTQCTAFMRLRCTAAWQGQGMLMGFDSFSRNQSIAAFLIIRGPVAFLGYGWESGTANWVPEFAYEVGEPQGLCREVEDSVFARTWTYGDAVINCSSWHAIVPAKAPQDPQAPSTPLPPPSAAAAADAGTISVLSATYGGNCNASDANDMTATAQAYCNGKAQCNFQVCICNLNTCAPTAPPCIPDPANGCSKDFTVSWRCSADPPTGRPRTAHLPHEADNQVATLSCANPLPPPPPPDASWYGKTPHPPSSRFRSVMDFGAAGDGQTDDTAAIQSAINAHRGEVRAKTAAVVYFPPGTYLVSDTLVTWCNTELRGSSLDRPTLRLAPSSPGFGNASALRPLLATNSGYNRNLTNPDNMPEWHDNTLATNDMFYMHIHNLNVDVSAPGNAGAVGIYWCVAQQTSLRGITITVGGGFSGLDICQMPGYPMAGGGGAGGGGTIEDLQITGGEYAIRGGASQWTFRGLSLDAQRTACVWLSVLLWQFAFVDIAASNAPVFLTTVALGDAHSSNVVLIDALLSNFSGPAAVLHDRRGLVTFLQNATLAGPTFPGAWVANYTLPPPGGVLTTWLPASPAPIERWSGWCGGDDLTGNFVGGVLSPQAQLHLPGSPLRPLTSRPRPFYDDLPAPPCNAITDCGATGTNTTDDTAALQACIDRCPAVYLPWGVYRVSDTLNLTQNTVLTGEMLANIYLAAFSPGFGDGAQGKALLDTPNDATARVQLSDLSLNAGQGNPGAVLLRWQAGSPESGMWDLNVNISFNVLYGIHAVGYGAGILSNVWVWGADHSWWDMAPMVEDHAEIGFLGESEGPLTAFGLACEHHHVNMIKITGAAKNYDFVVSQTEEATPIANASDTVHILLSDGASNITMYSALSCNWWNPQVNQLMAAWGVGENVTLFGLKGLGSDICLMNQPSTPDMYKHNGTRPDNPFYGIPADVYVPRS